MLHTYKNSMGIQLSWGTRVVHKVGGPGAVKDMWSEHCDSFAVCFFSGLLTYGTGTDKPV
jgi:hypothetical protein